MLIANESIDSRPLRPTSSSKGLGMVCKFLGLSPNGDKNLPMKEKKRVFIIVK